MEDLQMNQNDGEPPIYREMKPVPVTLENCILNSEDDYSYNQTEPNLVIKSNCEDGELSAEDINSMIMINEGPNALSSVREDFEKSNLSTDIRNPSDIKKILTCDLPKGGRFLSTKSLQRLSGGKKLIKKYSKYLNEDDSDLEDSPVVKIRKISSKQNKAVKENLDSTNHERKNKKKELKIEKLKIKNLMKGNSLEKISSKKKSLKSHKMKSLISEKKTLKKKIIEENELIKKKIDISSNESETEKSSETSTVEGKAKTLISRSGRIRKIKEPMHFSSSKIIKSKVLSPERNPETSIESERKTDQVEDVPVGGNPKAECDKENKSQRDLLQNILSESVESWFDVPSALELRGKKSRNKVKIIPKDSDYCFEEAANSLSDENGRLNSSEISEPLEEKYEEVDCSKVEETKVDDTVKSTSQSTSEIPVENVENPVLDIKDSQLITEIQQKKESNKNLATLNGKKVKSAGRQVMSYKKKRRKGRNIIVSSYLKNYGEKIDFKVELDPNINEFKKENTNSTSVVEKSSTFKKESPKDENENKKENFHGENVTESNDVTDNAASDKTESFKNEETSCEAEDLTFTSVTGNETKDYNATRSADEHLPKVSTENEIKIEDSTTHPIENNIQESAKKDTTSVNVTETPKNEEDDFEMSFISRKFKGKLPKLSPLKKAQSVDCLQSSIEPKIESPRKSAETPASLPSREKELNVEKSDCFVTLNSETVEKWMSNSNNESCKTMEVNALEEQQPENTEVNIKLESKGRKYNSQKKMRKKRLWTQARQEKFECRKARIEYQKKKKSEEDSKPIEVNTNEAVDTEKETTEHKSLEITGEKREFGDSFSTSLASSIPLKKRPRRTKISDEGLDEVKKEVIKEDTNDSDKQDCERRKSHREIKLTPKIVDMIASSITYKRPRKYSGSKEDLSVKEENIKPIEASKDNLFEQPLAGVPVENYLQSKMEANASNFECSWEPGDLVWARFAGNPFWPALILRDPFSNDEYSKVKYLGRLPRPFLHVQFLSDFGRRAWGPEIYIMSFNGLEDFERLKASLPEVNPSTQRKDLLYQQAFFTPKKMEKAWLDAVKEGDTLLTKSKDERITYMKIKYPLVKYAASVANGRLVPNERSKSGDVKSPQARGRKRKSVVTAINFNETPSDWPNKKTEDSSSKDTFECVSISDVSEGTKKSEKESPKITLKLVRSPKKAAKRKSSKSVDEIEVKKSKKRIKKELGDEECVNSDSGSNSEKGLEAAGAKQKKYFLFKGARTEKVCQICLEILENEKTVKCKGVCQGLFHKSCDEKIKLKVEGEKEGEGEGENPVIKNKKRKKLFVDGDSDNFSDSQQKESDEKEWRCYYCARGENPCFVCNSTSGNRQRCSVANCGKFYHHKCLKLYPQTVYNHGAPMRKLKLLQQNKTTESESPHYQILSCPLHVCHTCASDNPAEFNMKYLCEKLIRCIKCPSAYHMGNYCVPAGSTILNTSQIICAKHENSKKKSHVNISWCFICNMGGSLICCEWCPSSFHLDCLNIKPPDGPYICEECESGRFPLYGEVVWVKMGRYRWWPARILFPQEIPLNIQALPHEPWEFAVRFYGSNDHYWLNRGRVFLYQEGDSEQTFKGQTQVDRVYQRAVHEATKEYFLIQEERKSKLCGTNSSGVLKPPPFVKIKTNKAVGKVQLGNLSQSEPQTCDCDPNSEAPCSPGSDCLNRMLLVECNPNYCKAGSRCGNQSFEKREYPPLKPYRTEKRGWGLRSSIDIPKGSFIIEYVGEVVDDEEFKRRMKRKQETKDSNYYFLTIDKDRMIDAGPKGNLARFMNHSCSPNCETQKWTVNGDTRVGLFALRDIPAGTELTFNYNLDCIGNEKKECHCEEENCSGYIGVKAKNDKGDAFKNKIMRKPDKESEDECHVCNDGGELMVCDVPNCPKVYHLECVNLTEWPNEMWFCPRHQCSICNKPTKRCCKLCTAAFCSYHLDNNIFADYQGGLLCSKHSLVKPAQIVRKASYVNRGTSTADFEKPPPPKERVSPEIKKEEEILMEPNLTDNTPIVVENPMLDSTTSTQSRLNDGVSVQVLYVDEEGQIVNVDESATPNPAETVTNTSESVELPKPVKKRKRTNIPRKKLNPPIVEESENEKKASTPQGGINFESLMIKSVEDKILDSKLNLDNIYNIIGGKTEGGESEPCQSEAESVEKCSRDESNDSKPETVTKKEDLEVDRSRRSKYFKIITPEKFIKVQESESNQKKVTDFNYIEFMHPLRSARSKTKTDENTRK